MKKILLLLIIMVNVTIFSDEIKTKGAGDLLWFTNIDAALKDAKANDRDILINFTGSDWCHWCFKLDSDVFSTDDFNLWQQKNVTLLMIDFPQKIKLSESQVNHNQALAQIYGIKGFPTIVFIDKNGAYLGKKGYGNDVTTWLKEAEDIIND